MSTAIKAIVAAGTTSGVIAIHTSNPSLDPQEVLKPPASTASNTSIGSVKASSLQCSKDFQSKVPMEATSPDTVMRRQPAGNKRENESLMSRTRRASLIEADITCQTKMSVAAVRRQSIIPDTLKPQVVATGSVAKDLVKAYSSQHSNDVQTRIPVDAPPADTLVRRHPPAGNKRDSESLMSRTRRASLIEADITCQTKMSVAAVRRKSIISVPKQPSKLSFAQVSLFSWSSAYLFQSDANLF